MKYKSKIFDQSQKSVRPRSQELLCKRTLEMKNQLVHFEDVQNGRDRE